MGAGEFIAGRSEAQVQVTEVRKELEEMETSPEFEKRELIEIYRQDGVSPEHAKLLVETLSLVLTFVALVTVGVIKGKLSSMNLVTSVIEIVVVGVASAGGGYVLGTLIPRILGY